MLLTIEQLTETVLEVPLPCNRCNGSGYLDEYRRIQSGVCFKCDGKGTSNRVKTIVKETTSSYEVNAQILKDGDSFEAMFERYKDKMENFNIFDWFDAQ